MTSASVRRNGPYAPLSANYADDDAIATLDLEENDRAELLYLRGLAYCARDLRLNGFISDVALAAGKILRRSLGKKGADTITSAAERLVKLNIWVREPNGYRIRAWSKWNRTWDEIEQTRAADRSRKAGSEREPAPFPVGTQPESVPLPNGFQREDARIPDDFQPESVRKVSGIPDAGARGRGTSLHVTTRHVTTDTRHGTESAPPNTTQTLIAEWIDHTPKRPPAAVIGQVGKQLTALLAEGQDPDDVRNGLVAWASKGLHPSTLPSVIHELTVNAHNGGRRSHRDQAAQAALDAAARVQARHQEHTS